MTRKKWFAVRLLGVKAKSRHTSTWRDWRWSVSIGIRRRPRIPGQFLGSTTRQNSFQPSNELKSLTRGSQQLLVEGHRRALANEGQLRPDPNKSIRILTHSNNHGNTHLSMSTRGSCTRCETPWRKMTGDCTNGCLLRHCHHHHDALP